MTGSIHCFYEITWALQRVVNWQEGLMNVSEFSSKVEVFKGQWKPGPKGKKHFKLRNVCTISDRILFYYAKAELQAVKKDTY